MVSFAGLELGQDLAAMNRILGLAAMLLSMIPLVAMPLLILNENSAPSIFTHNIFISGLGSLTLSGSTSECFFYVPTEVLDPIFRTNALTFEWPSRDDGSCHGEDNPNLMRFAKNMYTLWGMGI